jgi:serine/threonine protein kinase/TPR repeat protein
VSVPSHLGRYEIRGELGRGAMGVVYEAFDPAIGRAVAIKLLLPDAAGATSTELRARFGREAQTAGRLNHPNIVAVHEYGDGRGTGGDSPGQPFIVMELVTGRSLKSYFDADHRFPLEEAVSLMGDLLAALHHAHARGVIHRDIKPSNLIVLEEGPTLKVADFGIARIEHSDLTLTGATLGTTSHMSPEQFLGQPVDRRTDLYACGVVLYQFLTGELPFAGSPSTIMQKVLNQEALAPSLLNPTLPRGWDAVVRKALAKKAADRYESADSMATALRLALAGDPEATVTRSAVRNASRPRAGRRVLAGAGLAGVVAIAGGALIATRDHSPKVDPEVPRMVSTASAPATAAAVDSGIPPAAALATHPLAPSAEEIEREAWLDASRADSANAYHAFLQAYPKSPFVGRARVRLAVLEPKPNAPQPGSGATPARPSNVAQKASTPIGAATSKVVAPNAPVVASVSSAASGDKSSAPSVQACLANSAVDQRCAIVLGYYYRSDARDFGLAMKWFKAAADQGEARGQYELAMMHFRGQGVVRNPATAFELVKKAADQGFAMAQNRVGICYEHGEGVPQNTASAVEWYRKASAQGEPFGQNNLGRMLLFSRNYPHDPAQAYEYFSLSAAQKNPYAAYNLAYMFENGLFVTADKQAAARWYRTSLGNGLESAVIRDGGTEMKNIEHATAFIAGNP